jgi:hypothetical protein
LIVLFYTITQALPLLSFSFKAEESLYIFLLFIVDQIDNARAITIHEEKTTGIVVGNIDNGSSSNQKSRKKKKKSEKHQKGKQELEIDTLATDKADKVYTEANIKRNQAVRSVTIEYSEWQEKLLIKGINKIKNNELGWRFTVADALKIRDELIDHGK